MALETKNDEIINHNYKFICVDCGCEIEFPSHRINKGAMWICGNCRGKINTKGGVYYD